jgi:starch phosphorylase
MTDLVDANASVPHESSRTALSADGLRRAISDHLLCSIARPLAALTSEHYYRALALAYNAWVDATAEFAARWPAVQAEP